MKKIVTISRMYIGSNYNKMLESFKESNKFTEAKRNNYDIVFRRNDTDSYLCFRKGQPDVILIETDVCTCEDDKVAEEVFKTRQLMKDSYTEINVRDIDA